MGGVKKRVSELYVLTVAYERIHAAARRALGSDARPLTDEESDKAQDLAVDSVVRLGYRPLILEGLPVGAGWWRKGKQNAHSGGFVTIEVILSAQALGISQAAELVWRVNSLGEIVALSWLTQKGRRPFRPASIQQMTKIIDATDCVMKVITLDRSFAFGEMPLFSTIRNER